MNENAILGRADRADQGADQQLKRTYDSTVARIAGNIMAGLVMHPDFGPWEATVRTAVSLARLIVAETKRTEPSNVTIKPYTNTAEAPPLQTCTCGVITGGHRVPPLMPAAPCPIHGRD